MVNADADSDGTVAAANPTPRNCYARLWLPALAALAAFGIDVATPRGLIDGDLYVVAVLACVWVPYARASLHVAWALSTLMIVGFFLSPGDIPEWIGIANRLAGGLVIWVAALVVWNYALLRRERELAVSARTPAIERPDTAPAGAELQPIPYPTRTDDRVTVGWRVEAVDGPGGEHDESWSVGREPRESPGDGEARERAEHASSTPGRPT